MNYLSVEKISKSFGEKTIFSDVTFGIDKGQKIALVAKNGTGKTTLLNCLIGKDSTDDGRVVFRKEVSYDYMKQDDSFDSNSTILEEVLRGENDQLNLLYQYNKALAFNDENSIERLIDQMTELDCWAIDSQVKQIMGVLKLDEIDLKVGQLSGGQKKRIALAKVLLSNADIMFLDEPTNHLDLEMIEWLENYLAGSKKTILMVTHDRYFLEVICDEIFELDQGSLYQYKGNFSYYLEKKQERENQLRSTIDKAKNTFSKELNWIRRQPKARGTKQKGRVDRFKEIKKIAQQKIVEDELELNINMTRLGAKIVEFHKVRKVFGEKLILKEFNFNFQRNTRIGIIGQNGSGKSTFLKLMLGLEKNDTGKIVTGDTVKFGYYSQDQLIFKEDQKVIDIVKERAEFIPLEKGKILSAAQLLERFLFPKHMHYWHVSKLSGGEKKRLKLLRVLIENPNFLILDEPTNDLDIFTMSVLEEYLLNFKGCLIVVSHDRYFMDKMIEQLFVFKGSGDVEVKTGNYQNHLTTNKESKKNSLKTSSFKEKTLDHFIKEKSNSKKMSYLEKKEFTQLEIDIKQLESDKIMLSDELMNGSNSNDDMVEIGEKLKTVVNQLELKTNRWLELSELDY